MDVIYANKQDCVAAPDALLYADVDFAKLQDKSEEKLGEGEIRGLDSKTSEYAQVCLRGTGSNGVEAKQEETVPSEPNKVE